MSKNQRARTSSSNAIVAEEQVAVATPVVAEEQPTVVPFYGVVKQMSAEERLALRQRRVDFVTATLYQQHRNNRIAKHQAAQFAYEQEQAVLANRQAYELEVAQLAAKYGQQVAHAVAPRANSATVVPSSNQILVGGQYLTPCKAVHAICELNAGKSRKDILEACIAAGINKATAATQYGIWKKQQH